MSELYELPEGWEWKKLDSLARFQSGGTPKRSNKVYWNGNIPWIKISDINDNMYVNSSVEFITKDGLDNSSAKLFPKGTILYTIFATIGKIGILNIEATTNQAISGITPNEDTDIFYMYYGLKFITNEIKKISTGVAQNNINLTKLKAQFLPVPSFQEQKRIVAKLDTLFEKIDKAIALHQKNMDEADAFMGSVLNDVFGELEDKYTIKTVDELCTKITDGTHTTPKYIDRGVPFLSVKNISKGVISFDDTRFVSPEEHKLLSKRCNVEFNDILYTKVGTTGLAKVVDTNKEFSIFVSIALLKPKKDLIHSMFFQYMLNSPNCYAQSQKRTRGVANKNLVLKDIKQISFPLAPLNIQQKTVTYLDEISQKIEKIKSVQKEKMESLVALKASILDQAFRGEL